MAKKVSITSIIWLKRLISLDFAPNEPSMLGIFESCFDQYFFRLSKVLSKSFFFFFLFRLWFFIHFLLKPCDVIILRWLILFSCFHSSGVDSL